MAMKRLETWRADLERMRADEAFRKEWEDLGARRREVVPQMQELISDFLDDRIGLEELRAAIDVRTRNEWDVFGLKGMSGAMFLNMLVRYLPEHRDEVSALLRQAIHVPRDDSDARHRFASLYDQLEEYIESGVVPRRQIQPSRSSFFLSALWHIQSQEWVPFFESMRRRLAEDTTAISRTDTPLDRYFRFLEQARQVKAELDIDTWELEGLCLWLEREQASLSNVDTPNAGTSSSTSDSSKVTPEPRVWLIAPGERARYWDEFQREGICAMGFETLEDFRAYESREEVELALQRAEGEASPRHASLAVWEFLHQMKPGDRIYAKRGRSHIIGAGVITSDYRYEQARKYYRHVRSVDWTWTGEIPCGKKLALKTLTDISGHTRLVADLERRTVGESEDDAETTLPTAAPYTMDEAIRELFMERESLELLLNRLRHRKNLVLQGPPGVGKTFVASRLADLLVGRRDRSHVEVVQFHPSYSYEDFIQGYRPKKEGGFELRDGPFLRFCDRALQDPDEPYVLIVDEINRGNLGKIFGELMMLIEPDKRDPRWGVTLAYSEEDEKPFHVPPNLHIIGTMNTADRSLALVDYALRRRFSFATIEPAFESRAFGEHLVAMGADENLIARIRSRLGRLNKRIEGYPGLGEGYLVGHSYFCSPPEEGSACDDTWYERIVDLEIAPLLREYWYGDTSGIAEQAIEELRE